MNENIRKLKQQIIRLSNNPQFLHHRWFVKYHLEIVEKISLELCDIYPNADRNLVHVMVWFHDYGKILNSDKQYEMTQTKGLEFLLGLGFDKKFTEKVLESIKTMDSKDTVNLNTAPIEVKIISSADGAAHLVGPFFEVYLQENSSKALDELMIGNTNKAIKDWERKIVLPEVKKAFETRHKFVLEQNGQIPNKFLFS